MPHLTKPNLHFTWRRAAPFAAVAAVIGIVVVVLVSAAGPLAAFEAENGTLSSGATAVNLTGASGGKVVQFGSAPTPTPTPSATSTPTPTPTGECPAYPAFPNAACTGVPVGATLTTISGDYTISTAGTYSNMDIAGSLTIKAANVTVQNTRVRCTNIPDWCATLDSNSTLKNVEIGGAANGTTFTNAIGVFSGNSTSNNVLDQVNIHHTADGMRTDGGTTIQNSYIHDLNFCCGIHSDGSQSTGWSNVTFRHNTIEGGDNDAIFLKQESGNPVISNIVVDQNYLVAASSDGSVSSYGVGIAMPGVSNVTVTNNVFSTGWQVDAVSSGFSWTAFSNNKYTDGTAVSP